MATVTFRSALVACACTFFSTAAVADSTDKYSGAPLLAAAAEKAKDFAQYRYAYTVDHWSSDGKTEIAVKLRYDPRLEGDARWHVLSPPEDTLDKPQRKALKRLRKGDMDDNPILYDKLDEMIGEASLLSETEAEAVYVAQVDEEDTPKDALEVYITLNKPGIYVSSIELRSKKPFKPAAVAKVNKLVQTQHFAAPQGDGPAFLASSEAHIEGKAMFKSFSSQTRQIFSEIEQVGVSVENTD